MLAYNNISALRQQLKPTYRVHGVFEGRDWAVNGEFVAPFPGSFARRRFFPTFLCPSSLLPQIPLPMLSPSLALSKPITRTFQINETC